MKICKNCKHLHTKDDNGVWYNYFCHHPSHEPIPTINPVTGAKGYMKKNDLGGTYFCGEGNKFPNANRVNTDGTCELYEEKKVPNKHSLLRRWKS